MELLDRISIFLFRERKEKIIYKTILGLSYNTDYGDDDIELKKLLKYKSKI